MSDVEIQKLVREAVRSEKQFEVVKSLYEGLPSWQAVELRDKLETKLRKMRFELRIIVRNVNGDSIRDDKTPDQYADEYPTIEEFITNNHILSPSCSLKDVLEKENIRYIAYFKCYAINAASEVPADHCPMTDPISSNYTALIEIKNSKNHMKLRQ